MAIPVTQDFSFGNLKAEDVYEELSIDRAGVLQKARDLSRIAIPTLFPPEGYRPGDSLPPPNQSINSGNLSNLASRIMFTMLPPGKPVLKYNIIEHKLQPEIDANPELYSLTLLALSRRELANRQRLEATNVRTAVVQAVSQLLGGGNVMWRHLDIDWPSVHRMDSYVVKRNAFGMQLYNILKQKVALVDLNSSTRAFIENVRQYSSKPQDPKSSDHTDEIEIYCCCKMHHVSDKEKVWLYWEEFQGEMIPDSNVKCDYDSPPQYAAWLIPQYGHNWGLSYCELFQGDMYKVENLEGSLTDGAEAAALTWMFVKPGGVTSKKVVEKAPNLKVMNGDASDITVFRLEKGNDFSFVQQNASGVERRLGAAFLKISAMQRDAERVTAEEWRQMASELDQAMGGLYSELAQGLGRNIIMRFLALQREEDPSLAPLPPGIVRVAVVTGIDAMGLTDEEESLENALEVLSKFVGPQNLTQLLNGTDLVRRVLAGNSVKPDGLAISDNQQAANTQQAANAANTQAIVKGAAGPIAKEAAGAIMPQLVNGQQQQQPAPATT